MSKEKKIWISFIDICQPLGHYSLHISFPQSFNYPDYYKLVQEAIKAEKAKDAEKKSEIGRKGDEFLYRMQKISTDYRHHKPLEELPDSLWLKSKPLPPKLPIYLALLIVLSF